jgi:small subunit ribosomal protein S21
MIIIPIKDGENIERALKKFKKKFEKTGAIREIRNRQTYKKPTTANREKMNKAKYRNKILLTQE